MPDHGDFENLIRLLEGGEEAFRKRGQRYGVSQRYWPARATETDS